MRTLTAGSRTPARAACAAGAALLLLGGCAARFDLGPRTTGSADADGVRPVLQVAAVLQDGWRHLPVRGTTDYGIAIVDGDLAVTATGAGGASGLIRRVEADPARCPRLTWTWRVDALQQSADLRTKAGDDVAASVYVLFGDPGMLGAPVEVPTLKYVWAGGDLTPGEMLPNPYLPGSVVNVVVATQDAPLGRWRSETRDLRADYAAAFGAPPDAWIHAVALFTDNDQTGEPATAHYRDIALVCAETF